MSIKLLETLGFHRLLAGLFSAIVEVLRAIPGTGEYVTTIEIVAGFFGITGLTHATADKKLTRQKLATASAAVASLLALSYVPFLAPVLDPLRPTLEALAPLLGSAAVGARLKTSEVVKKEDVDKRNIDSV